MATTISPVASHPDASPLISNTLTNTPDCQDTSFQINLDTASIDASDKDCSDRRDNQPPRSLQKLITRLARVH